MGIAQIGLTPPPRRATGNVVLFSGRQKRHFSAYYRIKFQLIMMMKIMIMMIILMIMMMKRAKNHTNTMT